MIQPLSNRPRFLAAYPDRLAGAIALGVAGQFFLGPIGGVVGAVVGAATVAAVVSHDDASEPVLARNENQNIPE